MGLLPPCSSLSYIMWPSKEPHTLINITFTLNLQRNWFSFLRFLQELLCITILRQILQTSVEHLLCRRQPSGMLRTWPSVWWKQMNSNLLGRAWLCDWQEGPWEEGERNHAWGVGGGSEATGGWTVPALGCEGLRAEKQPGWLGPSPAVQRE